MIFKNYFSTLHALLDDLAKEDTNLSAIQLAVILSVVTALLLLFEDPLLSLPIPPNMWSKWKLDDPISKSKGGDFAFKKTGIMEV